MKENGCYFFQNARKKVQKMFGIKKKTTVKFPPKSKKKNHSSQFFSIMRLDPLYPRFRRELCPHTPLRSFRPHALDERQPIETQFNWYSCFSD